MHDHDHANEFCHISSGIIIWRTAAEHQIDRDPFNTTESTAVSSRITSRFHTAHKHTPPARSRMDKSTPNFDPGHFDSAARRLTPPAWVFVSYCTGTLLCEASTTVVVIVHPLEFSNGKTPATDTCNTYSFIQLG